MITPQIENLVASFFANPILLQSSQACAKYFWKDDRDGKLYYPQEDMGEPSGWWNPYVIDINEFMKINPLSGRKEIEPSILWTFNTQIQFAPLKPDQRSHYPNMLLIECLKKNKLLIPLQKHVGSHYEKIETALHGN